MSTYYDEVQEIKAQYPDGRSAALPALRLAQEKHGYLSPEALRECADAETGARRPIALFRYNCKNSNNWPRTGAYIQKFCMNA